MASGPKVKKQKRYVERPDVRQKLLDAAEAVVREEGYAAATVRRVSSRAGMTHQAVFYYFGSQDELLLSLLRRSNEAYCNRLNEALSSERPLTGLWEVVSDQNSTRLGLEFMALANHNEIIRAEIASNAVLIRQLEASAIQKYLKARGIIPRLSPELVSILTNSLARLIVQENTLGREIGHAEAERLVDDSLRNFESRGESNVEVEPIVEAMHPTA